jgi:hypothetical protein
VEGLTGPAKGVQGPGEMALKNTGAAELLLLVEHGVGCGKGVGWDHAVKVCRSNQGAADPDWG